MGDVIDYIPPPTVEDFIWDYRPNQLFEDWIVGPVGSGKTTGIFFKLIHLAKLQAPWSDGIRRTRAVVVRNTLPQLKDTTLKSWDYWFKDGQAGQWQATDKTFVLRFDDVECEVLFRPLDTPDDVARVLSLEITFALLDEFVQIPQAIKDALSGRLGRYPSKKDGGATNFGMWGSSNPDTEDNWWYDYLHTHSSRPGLIVPNSNSTYFHQPSGLSEDAENVENLPPDYYANLVKGKSKDWVKQFVEAEWGFSIAGKPVVSTFQPDIHIAKEPLRFDPALKLVIGLDPGIAGMAAIFGQQDLWGRLQVLGEIVETGMGAERFMRERVMPYIAARFPNADVVVAPDPAAANRAQTDERAVVDVIRRYLKVSIETNNRFQVRTDAIEHFTTRITGAGPALLIDPKACPILIRALKGGWRYALDNKRGDVVKGAEPEKNAYSHPGDACGYLCRYFHKQNDREARYTRAGVKPFVPPRSFGGASYHIR